MYHRDTRRTQGVQLEHCARCEVRSVAAKAVAATAIVVRGIFEEQFPLP